MSTPTSGSTRPSVVAEIDLALIDEDPQQPRKADNPGFSARSLKALAASLQLRGVKTPISVRDNPDAPGRYIINHGARRYRSSRIAGKATIPGFIDNDYNEDDQIIENLQRNEITPREVANYIGRELAKGRKKSDIAHALSKSPAFITQHLNLLDLPGAIADVFNSGHVKDVTVINELLIAYRKFPGAVSDWLGDNAQEVTRTSVKLLRKFLADQLQRGTNSSEISLLDDRDVSTAIGHHLSMASINRELPTRIKKPVVQVSHSNRCAHLLLHRAPMSIGHAWLRFDDCGEEREVLMTEIKLIALLDE